MTTTTSNRKNVGSIATTRLASKSNSSQGLDAERRDVFRTLAVNALAVSTLTLCSPKLNVPIASAVANGKGAKGGGGQSVVLNWGDKPIGRFPVAIDGVSNVPSGNAVRISYTTPRVPNNLSIPPKIIIYQRTGTADERSLAQVVSKSGEGRAVARALDIGNRIGEASEVLEGIKTSTPLSSSKRSINQDERDDCRYYDFELQDDATNTSYAVAAVVANRRLYVAAIVCPATLYNSNESFRESVLLSRSSFRVEVTP